MLRATRLLFPKPFTAVHLTPVKPPTARWVHTAPSTEYNVQPVIRHFKRQKHMPYFLEYMMWVVFGSMALHLIWLKMDYKDYRERTAHKTKLLEDLVQRVENGEQIDEDLKQEIKMLLMNEQMYKANSQQEDISDEYLNSLVATSDEKEEQQVTEKPTTTALLGEVDPNWTVNKDPKKALFL